MLALEIVEAVRSFSPKAANALMSKALPQIIPLSGGLGISVEEVGTTRAVASLPLKRRTRNHVGSIYFGAQMTLAELTMGLLLFKLFPPDRFGMLVKRVEADFRAKAKGDLKAVCELPDEALAALRAVEGSADGKAEAWVPVRLQAADGTVVTEARFLAALKKYPR